jgi:hypothetical protein
MEQSPSWEANIRSISQEVPLLWRHPKIHYRAHKNPALDPILSQMTPIHTLASYFQIHFSINRYHTALNPEVLFLYVVNYSSCREIFQIECVKLRRCVFFFTHNRDSSVGISTKLRAGRSRSRGLISGRVKTFSSPQRPDQLWGSPSLLYNRYRGVKRQGREADHLHLVPRLRMVKLYLHSSIRLYDVMLN